MHIMYVRKLYDLQTVFSDIYFFFTKKHTLALSHSFLIIVIDWMKIFNRMDIDKKVANAKENTSKKDENENENIFSC